MTTDLPTSQLSVTALNSALNSDLLMNMNEHVSRRRCVDPPQLLHHPTTFISHLYRTRNYGTLKWHTWNSNAIAVTRVSLHALVTP